MADFTVRQGDDFKIADTLEDAAGAAVNIQGNAIKLSIVPVAGGTALLDLVAASNDQVTDGSDGSKGKVSYTGGGATTAIPGVYLLSWYNAATKQTFPNSGYILFEVTADAPVSAGARFADSTDLEKRLGITFTADEHIRANNLLADASDEIRSEFGTISLVTDDVFTRPGTTDERVELPEVPVVAVTLVKLDGAAITDWYQVGNAIVRGRNLTIIDGIGIGSYGWMRSFGSEAQTLAITYTHGYEAVPARVKNITVEMVVRVWVNPASIIQDTVGPVETTYAPYADPPRGLQLTDSERRSLRRLFGSGAGSVWTG